MRDISIAKHKYIHLCNGAPTKMPATWTSNENIPRFVETPLQQKSNKGK